MSPYYLMLQTVILVDNTELLQQILLQVKKKKKLSFFKVIYRNRKAKLLLSHFLQFIFKKRFCKLVKGDMCHLFSFAPIYDCVGNTAIDVFQKGKVGHLKWCNSAQNLVPVKMGKKPLLLPGLRCHGVNQLHTQARSPNF